MNVRPGVPVIGAVLAFALGAGVVSAEASAESDLRLNEALADPASDWNGDGATHFRDDEWVEIVNVGQEPLDLTGFRLAGADTSWRFGFTGVLAPGATRVVFGSDSHAWEGANGSSQVGLRLNNDGGTVALWHLAAEGDTVLVDCLTYPDHAAEDDRSVGRLPDGGEEWRLFDAHNPYTGTELPAASGCFPSPGETVSCPTPAVPITWGRLKSRFTDR